MPVRRGADEVAADVGECGGAGKLHDPHELALEDLQHPLDSLAAAGREGVERVLEILQDELVRIMQLAGTPSLADVGPEFVRAPPDWLRGEVDRG